MDGSFYHAYLSTKEISVIEFDNADSDAGTLTVFFQKPSNIKLVDSQAAIFT